MSKIIPVMVLRIWVVLATLEFLANAVADDLQGTLRVILFLHGFQVVRFGKIEIFLGDNTLLK